MKRIDEYKAHELKSIYIELSNVKDMAEDAQKDLATFLKALASDGDAEYMDKMEDAELSLRGNINEILSAIAKIRNIFF